MAAPTQTSPLAARPSATRSGASTSSERRASSLRAHLRGPRSRRTVRLQAGTDTAKECSGLRIEVFAQKLGPARIRDRHAQVSGTCPSIRREAGGELDLDGPSPIPGAGNTPTRRRQRRAMVVHATGSARASTAFPPRPRVISFTPSNSGAPAANRQRMGRRRAARPSASARTGSSNSALPIARLDPRQR